MNVVMTRLREENLDMVMDWRMRPYITKYMNTDPVLTSEGQRKWFADIKGRNDQINWIIRLEGRPIGLINVSDIDRTNMRCSWGYYIAEREARSLQLAVYLEWSLYDYVFDTLKLHKIYCETLVENTQVVRLHAMCGSKEDGVLREHIFKGGIYHDVSVCSMLASDWLEKRKKVKYKKLIFE